MFFFFCDEPVRLSDHKVLHNIASSSSFFSISQDFLAFFARISYFTSLEFKKFNKTIILFYLDMRLLIDNSTLRASLAIYHLISNAPSWSNYQLVFTKSVDSIFRAFLLAPVTWNSLGYSLFCERREKWRVVSRGVS